MNDRVIADVLRQELPNTADSDVPAVLLPYQVKWVEDDAQFKVAEKSRRTGLTWAEASDNVLSAGAARDAGGQNVYYIGYNMDMAIEYIEACAMWARVFDQAAGEIEEGEEIFRDGKDERAIKTYTIHFASGFRIVALSSRPANLRGKQGVVVIDEAAFHGQLGELLKAAIALLMWGGSVRVISTHDGQDNPFNELVNEIRAGTREGSVHRIEFAQAVEQGLYRRVCMRLGKPWSAEGEAAWVAKIRKTYGDDASEELDVIPAQGSGTWLSSVLIEERMVTAPVLRYTGPKGFERVPEPQRRTIIQDWLELEVKPLLDELDPSLESVLGEDFARSVDLTVITPAQIQANLTRSVPFMLELRNMPHAQQEQILFYICDRLPRFMKGAVDAGGNGSAVAESLADRYGHTRIEQIKFSETWYREEMPPLKAAFEDGTIVLPRDADTARDLRMVKLIRGVARVPDQRTTGKDGGQRHGDAAISIALMYFASRNLASPIEFTAVPTRPRGYDNAPDSRMHDRPDTSEDLALPEQQAW